MAEAALEGRGRGLPRPRNAEATRAAILEAAKTLFARVGYDLTSLREIALAAGADAALVKRYFGGKEGLFRAVLEAAFKADPLKGEDRVAYARQFATMMADAPSGDETATLNFQFLLRAATSSTTVPMLNAAMQERSFGGIRDWLDGEDVPARARMLLALYIGLLVERLIRNRPLEGAERDAFVTRVTKALSRELGFALEGS